MAGRKSLRASLLTALAAIAVATASVAPAAAEPDVISLAPGDPECTISGTDDAEWILGTEGDDVICAGGGDDIITALSGNDIVFSGKGNDLVDLGNGKDRHADESKTDQTTDPDTKGAIALTDLLAKRELINLPTKAPQFPDKPQWKEERPPPPMPTPEERERDIDFRESLGFDTKRMDDLYKVAFENDSLYTYGAPFTDEELKELARREAAEQAADPMLTVIRNEPWYSGHFIDQLHAGVIVVNAPEKEIDSIAKLVSSFRLGETIQIREVATSLADLDRSHHDAFTEMLEVAKESDLEVKISFDVSDYQYHVSIIQNETDSDSTKTHVEEKDISLIKDMAAINQTVFDGVTIRRKFSTPKCAAYDCHTVEPAMAMSCGNVNPIWPLLANPIWPHLDRRVRPIPSGFVT